MRIKHLPKNFPIRFFLFYIERESVVVEVTWNWLIATPLLDLIIIVISEFYHFTWNFLDNEIFFSTSVWICGN